MTLCGGIYRKKNMKLEHIALSIANPEDIKNFYQDILGMNKVKSFVLNRSLANDIFGINKDTDVFLLQKELLSLEIFVIKELHIKNFNHICLAVDYRKMLFENAGQNGYTCICKKRGNSDLIFIKDKSGNIFELKDKKL